MNIKKTIEDWAVSTFPPSNSSYQVAIEQLPSAPPFLFTGNSGSGYCITIKPFFSSPANSYPQLGFWIPESGAQGSQCKMSEGDEEILACAVDWSKASCMDVASGKQITLANEDALVENLSTLFAEFLRDDILLPVLEKQLDDKGIAHEPFTVDMVGGIEPWDEKKWAFLFLPAEPIVSSETFVQPDWSSSRVLGITGDGRAALFSYNRHTVEPSGYVDHIDLQSQAAGIDSPDALKAWL